MTTEHDATVVEQIRRSPASARVVADDPVAVGQALADATGGRVVSAPEAPAWLAEARLLRSLADRVLAAEAVVADAEAGEQTERAALVTASVAPAGAPGSAAGEPAGADPLGGDGPAADRQAVRFALVILALAQIGGLAVYLVDGDVIAVVAPAGGLLVVAGVVLVHRLPAARPAPAPATAPAVPTPADVAAVVPGAPSVRAATAHLRRQQAAWKLAWWERGLPPATVADWAAAPTPGQPPATLIVVDPGGELDGALHAEMTAAVPAAVRVVLVVART